MRRILIGSFCIHRKKADPLDVFAREFMDFKKKPKSKSRSR